MIREHWSERQEKAWGTYERNKLIRFLYSQGTRQKDLVKAFKLSKQAVNAIIKRGDGKCLEIT